MKYYNKAPDVHISSLNKSFTRVIRHSVENDNDDHCDTNTTIVRTIVIETEKFDRLAVVL